mmetsp:Transcript_38061/g.95713  ORF Transcript_38061/g.95713 Transcript_38061/m.95713 type:complete len:229 (-) Transcript_38061:184-870(-)
MPSLALPWCRLQQIFPLVLLLPLPPPPPPPPFFQQHRHRPVRLRPAPRGPVPLDLFRVLLSLRRPPQSSSRVVSLPLSLPLGCATTWSRTLRRLRPPRRPAAGALRRLVAVHVSLRCSEARVQRRRSALVGIGRDWRLRTRANSLLPPHRAWSRPPVLRRPLHPLREWPLQERVSPAAKVVPGPAHRDALLRRSLLCSSRRTPSVPHASFPVLSRLPILVLLLLPPLR